MRPEAGSWSSSPAGDRVGRCRRSPPRRSTTPRSACCALGSRRCSRSGDDAPRAGPKAVFVRALGGRWKHATDAGDRATAGGARAKRSDPQRRLQRGGGRGGGGVVLLLEAGPTAPGQIGGARPDQGLGGAVAAETGGPRARSDPGRPRAGVRAGPAGGIGALSSRRRRDKRAVIGRDGGGGKRTGAVRRVVREHLSVPIAGNPAVWTGSASREGDARAASGTACSGRGPSHRRKGNDVLQLHATCPGPPSTRAPV